MKKILQKVGISKKDVDPPERTQNPLKAEIVELAEKIQDDEGVNDEEALKRAIQVLKNVMMKSPNVQLNEPVPEDFKCFISKELIQDPVVLETGCTYDRTAIEEHLSDGNDECPRSEKRIRNKKLMIPNLILEKLMSDWCKKNGVVYPIPKAEIEDEIYQFFTNRSKSNFQAVKDLVVLVQLERLVVNQRSRRLLR